MLTILTYDQIDQQQWRDLIETSAVSTWFQTDEAYRFYLSVGAMKAFAYGVVESQECDSEAMGNGQWAIGNETSETESSAHTPNTKHHTQSLKGVCVGYITKETNTIKQYLTCRVIIIGGPLLAEDISATALAALLKVVKAMGNGQWAIGEENNRQSPIANRPIYIESRNFHDYSKWKSIFEPNGFAYQPHLNYHVDTTSLDQVQARIGKHRWRYIRLSMRDGAKIVENPNIEQVRAFYTILQDLYKTKVKTPLWSWEFFERLYYVEHVKYILVELDGKIVGGTACVFLPGKAVYEWYACGLDNCRDDIRPLSVAIWGEMQYAAENGYPLFDFMGAGKPDEPYGVRDFKAEFGGELVEHGRFLCIRKPLLYAIGKLGVKWLKRRK